MIEPGIGTCRSASSSSMWVRISSRTRRTTSIGCPAGSVRFQSSYRLPGKIGQASPQPMVITTSEACTASGVRILGSAWVMSMPTSAIAATAAGLIDSLGADPAERTSTRSPARWVSHPAAIWERPALCTHTNNTLGLVLSWRAGSFMVFLSLVSS